MKTSFVTWFGNVVDSVVVFKDSFVSWMQSCLDSLGNWFSNVGTWFVTVNSSIWDSVKKIGEWFGNVISSFGEWFSNAIGKIVEFKDGVLEWFEGFFTWLWELFLGLFIPGYQKSTLFSADASSSSGGYFAEKNSELLSLLEGKIKYSELTNVFETFKNLQSRTPENITCELYGKTFTVIDWKYILEVRPTIYFWVRGFIYPFLIIYHYNQIYKLIRGSSYTGNGKSGGEISGQMSFDWGSKK